MDPEKFWRLTWYEWGLYMKSFTIHHEKNLEQLGSMMAHIANCTAPKKHGNWTRRDFVKLSSDTIVEERRLTLNEAKKLLGSKMKMPNGK